MKINPRCDLLIGNRPENDSDNQYLECEDCHRYEICKKHGCVEMCSPEETREATPNILEPSYDLINRRIDRMSISEQVGELRGKADIYNAVGSAWELNRAEAKKLQTMIRKAADTIEALSAKLADIERPAEDCGGGWIACKERLPEDEGMYLITAKVLEKIEIQYVFFQKNMDLFICNGIAIAWKPLPEPYHEP